MQWLNTRTGRRTLTFYMFIAPFLFGLICLGIIPLLLGFLTSFTNYDGLNFGTTMRFVGLRNYERLFADQQALDSIPRTALWTLINVPLGIVISFALALILNQNIRGRGFFRTLFYLPTVIPVVATVSIFKVFLDGNFGLLNYLISFFRPGTAIQWISNVPMPTLTSISVWAGMGGGMVILLAGLQGIPSELQEAARIDGANSWQVFWHVTFPLMTPVIFFMLIMGIIGSVQAFVIPMLFGTSRFVGAAAGMPPEEVYMFMVHVWRQLFVNTRYGYATALLWVLTVVVILLTIAVFWSQRFWVHYQVEIDEEKK
jgi:multiple sugar transport system permease protein